HLINIDLCIGYLNTLFLGRKCTVIKNSYINFRFFLK
ncbi:unnamed protein product, partial [marine sediment metagenome]